MDMLVAHRVIGPFFEAYSVLADELALLGQPADDKELVQRSLGRRPAAVAPDGS